MLITPADPTLYYDANLLAGVTAGTSIVVHNYSSQTLLAVISPTLPANDTNSLAIEPGETISLSPKGSKVWIKADGPVGIEATVLRPSLPVVRAELSQDLYTSSTEEFRRIRVDAGQTGFFEGREFRTFLEINVPSGQSIYVRFISPIDFILFEQDLALDSGSVRFTALTGATPAGTYSTSLPIVGKNRMASRKFPFYVSQVTMATGGTASGGTIVELFRVVAANATAQQRTVSGLNSTERGLPAGTYYLRFENFGTGSATGVYSLAWEERP